MNLDMIQHATPAFNRSSGVALDNFSGRGLRGLLNYAHFYAPSNLESDVLIDLRRIGGFHHFAVSKRHAFGRFIEIRSYPATEAAMNEAMTLQANAKASFENHSSFMTWFTTLTEQYKNEGVSILVIPYISVYTWNGNAYEARKILFGDIVNQIVSTAKDIKGSLKKLDRSFLYQGYGYYHTGFVLNAGYASYYFDKPEKSLISGESYLLLNDTLDVNYRASIIPNLLFMAAVAEYTDMDWESGNVDFITKLGLIKVDQDKHVMVPLGLNSTNIEVVDPISTLAKVVGVCGVVMGIIGLSNSDDDSKDHLEDK